MYRTTKGGALYAIIVFVIGFIFGTIRVLLLVPRLGETNAVIVEAPIILAASWFVLPLVRGSARCRANGPGSIINGFGRVPRADVL